MKSKDKPEFVFLEEYDYPKTPVLHEDAKKYKFPKGVRPINETDYLKLGNEIPIKYKPCWIWPSVPNADGSLWRGNIDFDNVRRIVVCLRLDDRGGVVGVRKKED